MMAFLDPKATLESYRVWYALVVMLISSLMASSSSPRSTQSIVICRITSSNTCSQRNILQSTEHLSHFINRNNLQCEGKRVSKHPYCAMPYFFEQKSPPNIGRPNFTIKKKVRCCVDFCGCLLNDLYFVTNYEDDSSC